MSIPDLNIKIVRYFAFKYQIAESYIYRDFAHYIRKELSSLEENFTYHQIFTIVKNMQTYGIVGLYRELETEDDIDHFQANSKAEILLLICEFLKVETCKH